MLVQFDSQKSIGLLAGMSEPVIDAKQNKGKYENFPVRRQS
jgi:hypothetical protein